MFQTTLPVRYLLNPVASPFLPYGHRQEGVLDPTSHEAAVQEVSSWPGYQVTPLRTLGGMAGRMGIRSLLVKDEGSRFGLGSFKALGGMYGVCQVVRDFLGARTGPGELDPAELLGGRFQRELKELTVTCASAGNHGQAVARGAQIFGCRSVVFLPARTSHHRREAIQALGAEVRVVEGGYDHAVRTAALEAGRRGWRLVSDTSLDGDEDVPRRVLHGYSILAREILRQLEPEPPPSHVFLQAGVGGLAASVTAYYWMTLGPNRPKVVVVEPAAADCVLESALHGFPSPSPGGLETSMECLACREVSGLAWTILQHGADAFLTIPDSAAEEMVDHLARGLDGDSPIFTQSSGAAGLAGLASAVLEPGLADPLGLGQDSRVLVVVSEGPRLNTPPWKGNP